MDSDLQHRLLINIQRAASKDKPKETARFFGGPLNEARVVVAPADTIIAWPEGKAYSESDAIK